jgi:hypothetical protein
MNSSEVTADASSSETDSFAPIDHARIVLTPLLLLGGLGLLFLGGENFLSSAVPAAVLFLFAVLNGEKVYQKWSSAPEPS